MKYVWLLLFIATVPFANYLIGNVGTVCVENGPCLIPVGFGLMAPSGVIVIGVALVLRDLVQELLGKRVVLFAILAGGILSAFVAPPALALASCFAFLVSEISDFAVYTPLRKKNLPGAVFASGLVGSLVDSAVFLFVAFGSLQFIAGQIVGKMFASVFAVLVLLWNDRNKGRA